MSKYSEIEIQTAKRLHDAGYKWLSRTIHGNVGAFSHKPYKDEYEGNLLMPSNGKAVLISGKFTPIFESINWTDNEPTYIEDIINPQIIDDVEKRYLKGVIRPFRDKVLYIIKISTRGSSKEYISISFATFEETYLPCFKKGTMYNGMEANRRYTPDELGL